MQEGRKYRAFISYRHTIPDKPIAIALQQQLEQYKVPGYLRKQGYPSGLGLVFRDEADLPTSSDLGNQIQTALDNSDYLIVICSTNTPHSKYVAAEIEYFKRTKGNNNCLALLVKGDPSTEKVFPDELLTRYGFQGQEAETIEPIAADVRADTLKSSLKKLKTSKLKIVAGLLGCNYDDLVRRQREYRLKRITILSIAAAVFFVCFGLFLLRQLYIVNESQRKTQLAYSEMSLKNGNHVIAMEQAMVAMQKNNPLFSRDPSKDTKDSLFKASLSSAFSKYAQIPLTDQLENGTFTLDGKQILVKSDLWIKTYDLQGKLLWEFTAEGKGDRIVAVSPDGSRAAIIKTDLNKKPPTVISLWDTKNRVCITELLGSSNYSVQDILQYEFSNVLQANFSPDGKHVCAYRSGGYFNENDVIQFWNSSTGTLEKSIDGSLLGTREEGGQGRTISEARYFSSGIIRFKGSKNYVFFHPAWKEPVVIPLNESCGKDYINLSEDERFGIYTDSANRYILKDRYSQRAFVFLQENESNVDVAGIKYVDQKYAIVPLTIGVDTGKRYTGVQIIDLASMETSASYDLTAPTGNQFKGLTLMVKDGSDQVYILCTDGSMKLKNSMLEKTCSTLCMLTISENNLRILSEDLYYLNEGIWSTIRLKGGSKDFLASQRTDKSGNMKVLEINSRAKKIQNLYHIQKGEEFNAQNAQINAEDNDLLIKENTSLLLYSLNNRPAPILNECCEAFAQSTESPFTVTFSAGVMKVWKRNELQKQLPINEKELSLYMSQDGSVLLGLNDKNEITLWDTSNLRERCRIELEKEDCREICLSPKGKTVAVMVGNNLTIFDSETGDVLRTLSDQIDTQYPLDSWSKKMAFSPDGSQIACITKYYPDGQDKYTKVVQLWNVETGEKTGLIPTIYVDKKDSLTFVTDNTNDLPSSINGIFFSQDGAQICTSLSSILYIWDIKSKKQLHFIQEEGAPQNAPTIYEKRKLLIYQTKGAVHAWNLETGQKEKTFTLEGGLLGYAVSPEERWLLGLGPDGVWLFDLETGACVTKVLNENVLFSQWVDKGEYLSYYSFENNELNNIPYLYEKPSEICQQWLNNKE